jgi:anti-sigma B factor antagonist
LVVIVGPVLRASPPNRHAIAAGGSADQHGIGFSTRSGRRVWDRDGRDSTCGRDLPRRGAVRLAIRAEGRRAVLQLGGEVDAHTASAVRELMLDLLAAGHNRLIVDLEHVEVLSSIGVGVLVAVLKRVRAENGSLQLVCAREETLRVFRITRLDRVFSIHDSLAAALATTD